MTPEQIERAYFWWLSHYFDGGAAGAIARWHVGWLARLRKAVGE